MGILTRFSGRDESYDILCAVSLHKYRQEKNASKQMLRNWKSRAVLEIQAEFIGNTFDILQNCMAFHMISFELYHESKCILKTGSDLQLISSCSKSVKNLKLVTSPLDIYPVPQCVKKPGKSADEMSSYVSTFGEAYGEEMEPDPFATMSILEIARKFQVNLEIFEKHWDQKSRTWNYKLRFAEMKYERVMKFHYSPKLDIFFLILDEEKYFATQFQCPNSRYRCYYSTGKKDNFDRHVAICKDPKIQRENPECVQLEYGPNLHPMNMLRKETLVKEEPSMDFFVFYDIESLCLKDWKVVGKSEILQTHKLLSISANAYLHGNHITETWVVENDSDDAEQKIVVKFLDFLLDIESRVIPNAQVEDSLEFLAFQYEELKADFARYPKLAKITNTKRTLGRYKELNVFGYNSGRYDLQILMQYILAALENRGEKYRTSLTKKGRNYFSVRIGNLHFKDLLSFTSPMPLDKYLKTWTSNESKKVSREISRKCENNNYRFSHTNYFNRLKR